MEEAIDDFSKSYAGRREYYGRHGKAIEEIEYGFFCDTASFLQVKNQVLLQSTENQDGGG